MTGMETYFPEVRSFLNERDPSEHNFRMLCELLVTALHEMHDHAAYALVPYVDGMLRRWPGRLRKMPHRWLGHVGSKPPWHVSILQPLMRSILISDREFSPPDLAALLDGELFKPITHLAIRDIRYEPNPAFREPLRILLESDSLLQLEALTLARFVGGERGYQMLAQCERVRGIRELSLRHGICFGISALAASEHLENLRTLDLGYVYCGMAMGRNELSERVFGADSKLISIEQLGLRATGLDDRDLEALADGPMIATLTHLDLRDNPDVTEAGLSALLHACASGQLRNLSLSKTQIGDQGLNMIAESDVLTGLEVLHVHDAGWGEDGARAMARSETLPRSISRAFRTGES